MTATDVVIVLGKGVIFSLSAVSELINPVRRIPASTRYPFSYNSISISPMISERFSLRLACERRRERQQVREGTWKIARKVGWWKRESEKIGSLSAVVQKCNHLSIPKYHREISVLEGKLRALSSYSFIFNKRTTRNFIKYSRFIRYCVMSVGALDTALR